MSSPIHPTQVDRMTRRRLTGGALAGSTALALAACGTQASGDRAPESSTQPVTVKAFIGGVDAIGLERWQPDIAAPYAQRRPNVTLELISQSAQISGITTGGTLGVVEKLVAMMAGGDPPDINDLPRSASWQMEAGFLDDKVDGFVKRDKYDTRQFNQKEFNYRAVHQGKVLQIPFKIGGNSLVFVYNRDAFQQSGVPFPSSDPSRPWDWNTFAQTLERLTSRSGSTTERVGLRNYAWHIGSWPLLWETDWVSADGKRITCDSPEMLDCYTKFSDLFTRYRVVLKPGEEAELFGPGDSFRSGKTAMAIMSSGSWPTYITRGELTNIGVALMPRVKISTPDVNTHSMSIVRGSRNQEEAWGVIKYLNEGSLLAHFTNRLPAILKDVEPWASKDLERFPHVDSKLILHALQTHVPQTNLGQHKHQDDMLRVLNPAMLDMLNGKEAPVPLLRRLKPELQAIADRA
jgi:ABC-type glycerol-3-phosphate transport system substrate-binding protein